MYVLVTCKHYKDQTISSCEKVEKPSLPFYGYGYNFRLLKADNSVVASPIHTKLQILAKIRTYSSTVCMFLLPTSIIRMRP